MTHRFADAVLMPALRAGRTLDTESAVRGWATVGWLLSVEGRAYIEDLDGGVEQPEMRRVVLIRLVELLADIDARLAGRDGVPADHQLALAWEYGLHNVLAADGASLAGAFGLDDQLGATGDVVSRVTGLWERLCEFFPGEVPDPLVPAGQGEILRALRTWSKLAVATGIDASFLEPFLKDA